MCANLCWFGGIFVEVEPKFQKDRSVLVWCTIIVSLVFTNGLHAQHVAKIVLTAAIGLQMRIIIFITDNIAYGSVWNSGLISWWRVKVERLLLLRVRTRPVSAANPFLSSEVALMAMLVLFQANRSLYVWESASLIHGIVNVGLLHHHMWRTVEAISLRHANSSGWVEVGASRRILIVFSLVIVVIPMDWRWLFIVWRHNRWHYTFTPRFVCVWMRRWLEVTRLEVDGWLSYSAAVWLTASNIILLSCLISFFCVFLFLAC